jgi:hypothetical protein
MPQPLYPQGKSPWYPLDRRLGGPQSRSGHGIEEKNSQPPLGLEARSSSPYSVAILPELPQLLVVLAYCMELNLHSLERVGRGSGPRIF